MCIYKYGVYLYTVHGVLISSSAVWQVIGLHKCHLTVLYINLVHTMYAALSYIGMY